MGTTQTIVPNGNKSGATNFNNTGGGSVWGAISDSSDATWIKKDAVSGLRLYQANLGTYTVPAGYKCKRVRAALRFTGGSSPKYSWRCATTVAGLDYAGLIKLLTETGTKTKYTAWSTGLTNGPDSYEITQAMIDAMWFELVEYRDSSGRSDFLDAWVQLDIIDQPTVTVNTPGTTSLRPTVSWVYSDGDGDPQTDYQVKVFSAAQYGAGGFDPETSTASWDSGELLGEDASTQVDTPLLNSTTYKAYVKVAHDGGLAPYWSDWVASASFALAVTTTTTPTLSGGIFNEVDGRVEITVSGAAPPGGVTQTLRVEKSYDAGGTWAAVRGYTGAAFGTPYSVLVYDYEAPADVTITYRAKAIGVNATDDDVSSDWSTTDDITPWTDGQWWLKCVADPSLNVSGVRVLTDPDISIDEAITVLRPLGSTRAITVSGDITGQDGTWTIQVTEGYDDEMAKLLAVLTYQGVLLVQDPFRGFRYVRLTSRGYVPQGTGDYPRATWTVSYVEVDVPAVE